MTDAGPRGLSLKLNGVAGSCVRIISILAFNEEKLQPSAVLEVLFSATKSELSFDETSSS